MAYIGNSPGNIQRGRRAVYEFTATNAQTVFSGADDTGISLDLQDSNENDVYLNGSRLIFNDDYTIAGEVLTLTAAAAAGDILVIVTQDDIANVASYTKAEADARYINYDGDIVNGDIQVVGNISLGDNNRINFGSDSDLQIYHNAGTSFITESGPSNLKIGGENLYLQNTAHNEHYLEAIANQGVTVYYNGSPKLATTATGIDVTGTVTADGITSNNNSHIFTSPSYNVIDFISDNNDDGSNDDIIVNFKNGSAGTIKAELRWDESSDTFEISRADNRGDLVLASNGNVGIGTTSPDALLHVQHTAVDTAFIVANRYNDTSPGSEFRPIFAVAEADPHSAGTTATIIGNHNRHIHIGSYFGADGTTSAVGGLTILSTGNVGIGVASPEQKLDIMSGTLVVRPSAASADANGSASAVNNLIHLRMPYGASAGSVSNNGARVGIKFTGRNDGIGYGSDDGKSAAIYGVSEETGAGYNRQFGMAFYTSAFDQSQAEKARLDHAGRWMVPNQPAACFKSSTGTTNTQRFGAVSVLLNNGNYLDTGSNSGRFNCPVTGMYRVTINTSTSYNGHYGWIAVYKNGGLVLDHIHWNKGGTSMHVNPSIQVVVQCSSGDYLEGWYVNANSAAQDTIDMAMVTMELIG